MSKAANRRRAAELAAPRKPRELDDRLARLLTVYAPRDLDSATWHDVRPITLELARFLTVASSSFPTYLSVLANFLGWANVHGFDVDRDDVLRPELIQQYALSAFTDVHTAATVRARLNRVRADRYGPSPDSRRPSFHRPVRPPYTPGELAALVRMVRNEQTATGRQAAACVGLGVGAGLGSVDLRDLYRRDVVEDGPDLDVVVRGPRPRNVPARREHVALIVYGLHGIRRNQLVVGAVRDRRNIAAGVYARLPLRGDAMRPDQGRLRSTWLAASLTAGVPLPTIMQAAGLKSVRTLSDLMAYVQVTIDGEALR